MKQKNYGSAVFTALQARYMSLEYIAYEARHRQFDAVVKGDSTSDWWADFWRNMAILEAERINAARAERR